MNNLQDILDKFKQSEIAKIRQTELEKSTKRRTRIYQFDLIGNPIKSWKSINEVVENGFDYRSIWRGLKSNPTTICKGFLWSYSESVDISNIETNQKYKLGDIVVTDLNGNILSVCKSTKEVSEKFSLVQGNVRRVLTGKYKQIKNYKIYFKKN
jgi:hypothetical protein